MVQTADNIHAMGKWTYEDRMMLTGVLVALIFLTALALGVGWTLYNTAARNAEKNESEFKACVLAHPPAECALSIRHSSY